MQEPGPKPVSVESTPVLTRPRDGVALIELNRPSAANRIEREDLVVLTCHLAACEEDDEVHTLVLTGRGRHFSAGFDLRALSESASGHDGASAIEDVCAFEAFANRLEKTRLIVVAAINGPVLGGATDIALACDLRIGAHAAASMTMPAARMGLPLYATALQRYVTRLGLNHAKRLVFLAQKIEAREMLEIGFLAELVAPELLLPRALDIASEISAFPAEPLAAMKRVLNAATLGNGVALELRKGLDAAFNGPRTARLIAAAGAERRLLTVRT